MRVHGETMYGHSEKADACNPRRVLSSETDPVAPWSWTSQPPEQWEIHFCHLSHPVQGILLLCSCVLSDFIHVRSVTPWTVVLQAPLSIGFSRQEYWSGLSFPLPGDLPNPGIKPESLEAPTLQANSLPLSHWGKPFVMAVQVKTSTMFLLCLV